MNARPNRFIEFIKITSFTTFLSIVYGWLHDLVTAHFCPEYFLPPHHIIIIDTQSPVTLALIWGFVATWWMGALFGFLLALAATIGKNPLPFSKLKKPITIGLLNVLLTAYLVLATNLVSKKSNIDAVATTHNFSYLACATLGGSLFVSTIHQRRKSTKNSGAKMLR